MTIVRRHRPHHIANYPSAAANPTVVDPCDPSRRTDTMRSTRLPTTGTWASYR